MRLLVSSLATAIAGVCLFVARANATAPGNPGPGWTLEWQAPAECPPRGHLVAQVDRILGSAGPVRAPFAVRAVVTHAGARWHLALAMTAPERTSQRELDAESCSAVTAAAAVIVALTIEARSPDAGEASPTAADASIDDATGGPPDADDATVVSIDAEVPPDVPDRGEVPLPFFLAGSALGSLGELPRAALGVGGALGFARGPLQLEASIGYWPEVSHALAGVSSRGGTFRSLTAGARGCGVHPWGGARIGLCGGTSFTSMHAEAFGVTTPIAAGGAWPSLRGDALLQAPITRILAVRAAIGGVVPLARPAFEVGGVGVVYRPSAVALELGAGVEAHF